jgi:hypothetical protein
MSLFSIPSPNFEMSLYMCLVNLIKTNMSAIGLDPSSKSCKTGSVAALANYNPNGKLVFAKENPIIGE